MKTSVPIVTNVFVYGTLKRGQCRETMWPRTPLSIRPGFVRGWLFDLGPYPAMWCGDCHELENDSPENDRCPCDWIEGEVWTLAKEDLSITIDELDEIESTNQPQTPNQYDQILVRAYDSPYQIGQAPPSVLSLTYQFSDLRNLASSRRIHSSASSHSVAWPSEKAG